MNVLNWIAQETTSCFSSVLPADAMLLKRYTTVWTHTGRKMGWVSAYVINMGFVFVWPFIQHSHTNHKLKSWSYIIHLRCPLSYLLRLFFTPVSVVYENRFFSSGGPGWCVVCIVFIFTLKIIANEVLQLTSEMALSHLIFFSVHDAHLPVSSHRGLCLHDNTALSKVFSTFAGESNLFLFYLTFKFQTQALFTQRFCNSAATKTLLYTAPFFLHWTK